MNLLCAHLCRLEIILLVQQTLKIARLVLQLPKVDYLVIEVLLTLQFELFIWIDFLSPCRLIGVIKDLL